MRVRDLEVRDATVLVELIDLHVQMARKNPRTSLQRTIFVSSATIDLNPDGHVLSIVVKTSSHYFHDRVTVELRDYEDPSFFTWCDSENVVPFYDAFESWVRELQFNNVSNASDLLASLSGLRDAITGVSLDEGEA